MIVSVAMKSCMTLSLAFLEGKYVGHFHVCISRCNIFLHHTMTEILKLARCKILLIAGCFRHFVGNDFCYFQRSYNF